jgi:hypothetical protein
LFTAPQGPLAVAAVLLAGFFFAAVFFAAFFFAAMVRLL